MRPESPAISLAQSGVYAPTPEMEPAAPAGAPGVALGAEGFENETGSYAPPRPAPAPGVDRPRSPESGLYLAAVESVAVAM